MTIAFSCPKCRTPYEVGDDFAGRQVMCGPCGASMAVPLPAAAVPPPPASPAAPERRRLAFRYKLALLLGLVVLLLLAGGGLLWWFLSGPPGLADEFNYAPDDFEYVASVNVPVVVRSELFKSLTDALDQHYPNFSRDWKKAEADAGVHLADVDRVTVTGNLPRREQRSPPEFMVVIKMRKVVELGDLFRGEDVERPLEESKVGS